MSSIPIQHTMMTFHRITANARMSEFRSIPVERRAWHVTLTVREIPEWMLPAIALSSLPSESQSFWVRRRQFAQMWVKLDREAGGDGYASCVGFRRCPVCKRVMVGAAAHDYQEKMRRPKAKWEFVNGPACGLECRPKRGNVNQALN